MPLRLQCAGQGSTFAGIRADDLALTPAICCLHVLVNSTLGLVQNTETNLRELLVDVWQVPAKGDDVSPARFQLLRGRLAPRREEHPSTRLSDVDY